MSARSLCQSSQQVTIFVHYLFCNRHLSIKLRVDKGDVLHVIETENGIELTPYNPEFDAQMAVAEDIMHENRDLLRRLAK